MKKLIGALFAVTLMVIGAWSGPVFAGSIVLTGHDADYHATLVEPGEINFTQRAVSYVMDPLFNSFVSGGINKFLFVESQIPPPGGHAAGVDGMVASGYTLGTDFDLATAATLHGALNQLGTTYGHHLQRSCRCIGLWGSTHAGRIGYSECALRRHYQFPQCGGRPLRHVRE